MGSVDVNTAGDENGNSKMVAEKGETNPGFEEDEARDAAGPLPVPDKMADKRRKKSSFLSVDHSELNSHTYVYDANKSFEGMTIDKLPSESARPTMEELHGGQVGARQAKDQDPEASNEET